MTATLAEGDKAPDFQFKDDSGKQYTVHNFGGKLLLLSTEDTLTGVSDDGRAAAVLTVTTAQAADQKPDPWPVVTSSVKKDPRLEARITELLHKMTLEQKVARLEAENEELRKRPERKARHTAAQCPFGGQPVEIAERQPARRRHVENLALVVAAVNVGRGAEDAPDA